MPILSLEPEELTDKEWRGNSWLFEAPAASPGLQPELLVEALGAESSLDDGGHVTVAALLAGSAALFRDGWATITAHTRDDRIVTVSIQPLQMTQPEWALFEAWLGRVGSVLGLEAQYDT